MEKESDRQDRQALLILGSAVVLPCLLACLLVVYQALAGSVADFQSRQATHQIQENRDVVAPTSRSGMEYQLRRASLSPESIP